MQKKKVNAFENWARKFYPYILSAQTIVDDYDIYPVREEMAALVRELDMLLAKKKRRAKCKRRNDQRKKKPNAPSAKKR